MSEEGRTTTEILEAEMRRRRAGGTPEPVPDPTGDVIQAEMARRGLAPDGTVPPTPERKPSPNPTILGQEFGGIPSMSEVLTTPFKLLQDAPKAVKAVPGVVQGIVQETAAAAERASEGNATPADVITLSPFSSSAPGVVKSLAMKQGGKAAIAAQRQGIAVPRMITSDKPFVRSVGNLLAKAPLIGDRITLKAEEAIVQLGNKLDELRVDLGKLSAEEAGLKLQTQLDEAITLTGKEVSLKYKAYEKLLINKGKQHPVTNTTRAFKALEKRRSARFAPDPSQAGRQVTGGVEKGGMTVQAIQDTRTAVMRLVPRGQEERILIKSLTKDLENAVKAGVRPEDRIKAVRRFRKANRFANATSESNKRLKKVLKLDAGEQAIDKIVKIANGQSGSDVALLRRVRKSVPDDEVWSGIVSGTVEKLGRNARGEWDLGTLGTNLGKMSPEQRKILFPNPAHRQTVMDIGSIAKRADKFGKVLGSDSISLTIIGILSAGAQLGAGGRAASLNTGRLTIRALSDPPTMSALRGYARQFEIVKKGATARNVAALTRAAVILRQRLGPDDPTISQEEFNQLDPRDQL